MECYFLGAYWPARKESLHECSDRLRQFFAELVQCDPAFSQWYERAGSKSAALKRRADVHDIDYLRKLVRRGRHWTDIPRRVMKDLGVSFGLWNGLDEPKALGLNITCGSYVERLSNCVVLYLPDDLGALHSSQRVRTVLEATVKAWEPNWAGVMSHAAMDARPFQANEPFVDWMLFVSAEWLPTAPTLDPPAIAERFEDGTIIVVQDEPPDPRNPVHVDNIERVNSVLQGCVKIGT